MFKTKLKLFISLFLITTMDWNVKEGNIERNKFIADSIKNHIDYVTTVGEVIIPPQQLNWKF